MSEFKGLYVHVPFCRRKCPYCDFYSEATEPKEREFLKLILTELSLTSPELSQFPTVYFGGGTPSILPSSFFEAILSKVGQFSEVTVEFNPEDAATGKLKELKEAGVNRISLGIQSLSDRVLKALGRKNREKDNLKALENALSVFSNVSVDLIYGAPGQKPEEFLKDLERITTYPVKHVSLYALTVYEETPLSEMVEKGQVELPAEEEVREAYYGAVELLKSRGFTHYEISNFAIKGFESKHNLIYWRLENYLGLGPSAASFQDGVYWKNVPDYGRYRELLKRGEPPINERVEFKGRELLELKITMGMRLIEGVEAELFPKGFFERERVKGLLEEGYVELAEGRVKLGEKGLFVSNAVIGELLSNF
ncbi:radical SAM family heme chaperone HemW [Thermovibrio sp.]